MSGLALVRQKLAWHEKGLSRGRRGVLKRFGKACEEDRY